MKVSIMKKIAILLVAAFALLGVNTANAQSRTSYFMEGSYIRSEFNPALVPTRGYVLLPGLSGVNVNFGTNFLSFDNFIYKRGDQYVTALHKTVSAEELKAKLPANLNTNLRANVNLLGLGFYTKKIFWSAGLNLRSENTVSLSQNILTAVKTLGDNGHIDLGSTAVNSNEYLEAYVGSTFPIFDWLSVGVKGKVLFGLANLSAQFDDLYLDINEDAVTAQLNGSWRANSFVLDNRALATRSDVSFNELLCVDDMEYLKKNLNNFGAAIDFGVEMRFFSNHLKVSAAVVDLGFINWAATSHIGGEVTGGFEYTGVSLTGDSSEDVVRPINGSDTFINTDNLFKKGSYEGYRTDLTYTINLGAEYNLLKNKIAFGLFSQTKVLNNNPFTEVTASVNLRPTNWMSASVTQTFIGGEGPGVYGAAINFHPAIINFYLGIDYIDTNYISAGQVSGLPIYLSRNAKSLNLYAGMAFNFGRPKHLKEANKARWKK